MKDKGSSGLSFSQIACAFSVGVVSVLAALPYLGEHVAPPLTPSTLPPKLAYNGIIGTVEHLDGVLRSLTPPNLLLFRNVMGYLREFSRRARRGCGVRRSIAPPAL
jgi:hypothetical protein